MIEAKLGRDWEKRIYTEAEAFYRDNWPRVAHLYKHDVAEDKW